MLLGASAEQSSVAAYADLEELLALLQNTPLEQSAFERRIDPVFPLQAYLDRMLWVSYTQNGDAVAQNFYLYAIQSGGVAQWTQLPWDSDISFGADWRDPEAWLRADDALLLDGGNHFSRRLLEVPGLASRYRDRFLAVLAHGALERVAFEQLERYRELVERDLALDAQRWGRSTALADAFEGLSSFVSQRGPALRAALGQR